jgi:hypothetical protein
VGLEITLVCFDFEKNFSKNFLIFLFSGHFRARADLSTPRGSGVQSPWFFDLLTVAPVDFRRRFFFYKLSALPVG